MIVTNEKQLRIKSESFLGSPIDLSNIVKKLEKALDECSNQGVGLAAIQIGMPVQVGIIRTKKLNINLFNAEIISGNDIQKLNEGCLSFPNQFIDVFRMGTVTFKNGDGEVYTVSGFEAQAVQHEIDHWNSILMFDRRA